MIGQLLLIKQVVYFPGVYIILSISLIYKLRG